MQPFRQDPEFETWCCRPTIAHQQILRVSNLDSLSLIYKEIQSGDSDEHNAVERMNDVTSCNSDRIRLLRQHGLASLNMSQLT